MAQVDLFGSLGQLCQYLVELGLNRSCPFELDVKGRLQLPKEHFMLVEPLKHRRDDGFEQWLEGGSNISRT